MTNSIATGNLLAASTTFCSGSSDSYYQVFLSIGTNTLNSQINRIGTLSPVFIKNDAAEFYFEQTVNGQLLLFPVEFGRENGVWKIVEF